MKVIRARLCYVKSCLKWQERVSCWKKHCGGFRARNSLRFTSMGFQHVFEIKHAFKCLSEENT